MIDFDRLSHLHTNRETSMQELPSFPDLIRGRTEGDCQARENVIYLDFGWRGI
jgi:hypothetical protein